MATSRPKKGATTAAAWRARQNEAVEMPSGNQAVLRRIGMEKFLGAGFMPDSLRGELTKVIGKASRKPVKVEDIGEGLKAEEIAEWMVTLDRLVCQVFVEPHVRWHQREKKVSPAELVDPNRKATYEDIPEEERDPESLYTDELSLEDKQFAFQFATGGSTDLTQFREAAASSVAGVPAGKDVAVPTE